MSLRSKTFTGSAGDAVKRGVKVSMMNNRRSQAIEWCAEYGKLRSIRIR